MNAKQTSGIILIGVGILGLFSSLYIGMASGGLRLDSLSNTFQSVMALSLTIVLNPLVWAGIAGAALWKGGENRIAPTVPGPADEVRSHPKQRSSSLDELKKLAALHRGGSLTDSELIAFNNRILNPYDSTQAAAEIHGDPPRSSSRGNSEGRYSYSAAELVSPSPAVKFSPGQDSPVEATSQKAQPRRSPGRPASGQVPGGSGMWFRGDRWTAAYGQTERRVRCLDCDKDIYFPAGQVRHAHHRIALLDADSRY